MLTFFPLMVTWLGFGLRAVSRTLWCMCVGDDTITHHDLVCSTLPWNRHLLIRPFLDITRMSAGSIL